MRIALIENGTVARIILAGADWPQLFPGAVGVESDTANVGDTWTGSAFVPPAAPPPSEADLMAYAADLRWRIETGGITVAGTSVRTDEKSQAKISGAVILLTADQTIGAIDWEAQPGVWVSLDAATMQAIGVAVGRHVQACFTALKAVQEAITAGEIVNFEQIDAADWPANG
ncbi:DUF4376 domain-containing protein [Xanthobacter sp. 91]|uniref:DUF4376 domain-containing protein n=1 Tax=Xanthobacter sp. 91 TaxID=1117244 RepID=UPI00068B7F4B|nr:DUF4376 domain-containing protein [Xanthobacter sp. 91]